MKDRARFAQTETCPFFGRETSKGAAHALLRLRPKGKKASCFWCFGFSFSASLCFPCVFCFVSSALGHSPPVRDTPRRGPFVVGALGRSQTHHDGVPMHDFLVDVRRAGGDRNRVRLLQASLFLVAHAWCACMRSACATHGHALVGLSIETSPVHFGFKYSRSGANTCEVSSGFVAFQEFFLTFGVLAVDC